MRALAALIAVVGFFVAVNALCAGTIFLGIKLAESITPRWVEEYLDTRPVFAFVGLALGLCIAWLWMKFIGRSTALSRWRNQAHG